MPGASSVGHASDDEIDKREGVEVHMELQLYARYSEFSCRRRWYSAFLNYSVGDKINCR